ncbi:MAG TPA: DeoR family transcriptional regulator [Bacteroidia bacterium]|nr:DeoR family transcriptional regulator [Bacteroidia bacterium]
MFSTSTAESQLIYVPNKDRESYLLSLYNSIDQKIRFFSLPQKDIKKLAQACQDVETAAVIGFDTETVGSLTPEDIYNFCLATEQNHSPAITHFEAWISKNRQSLSLTPDGMLSLISSLSKSPADIASLDITSVKASIRQVLKGDGNIFTQAWMLRIVLAALQPFRQYSHAFSAVVQSVFFELKGKTLSGLLHTNLEALYRKKDIDTVLKPYSGLSISELRETDLSPVLELGYDIFEEHLLRIDNLLRQIFREQTGFAKKDSRGRNLLNFLFDEGAAMLSPHMAEFNERQQQIIRYLFAKRYLSTKELTLDFKCDRKTIQRDFARLLSTEVVHSSGNGSALRYCINLKNNGYDMLEIYSTPVQHKEEYQESLFGEEVW